MFRCGGAAGGIGLACPAGFACLARHPRGGRFVVAAVVLGSKRRGNGRDVIRCIGPTHPQEGGTKRGLLSDDLDDVPAMNQRQLRLSVELLG